MDDAQSGAEADPDDNKVLNTAEEDEDGAQAAEEVEAVEEVDPVEAERQERERLNQRHRFKEWVINFCFGILTGVMYVAIGCAFYAHYEGWDILTTLYFTSVSMTTIGYGDVRPETPDGQWFTIFYAMTGIGLM
jgi:hypothetical protein